jgi:hypothetical protein
MFAGLSASSSLTPSHPSTRDQCRLFPGLRRALKGKDLQLLSLYEQRIQRRIDKKMIEYRTLHFSSEDLPPGFDFSSRNSLAGSTAAPA